jgi:hypothetical protein
MSEVRLDFEHGGTGSLTTILESAADFGLTHDEIWETFVATIEGLPAEVRSACIDGLTGELARRLLESEASPSARSPRIRRADGG